MSQTEHGCKIRGRSIAIGQDGEESQAVVQDKAARIERDIFGRPGMALPLPPDFSAREERSDRLDALPLHPPGNIEQHRADYAVDHGDE